MINETLTGAALEHAHQVAAVPSVLILYVTTLIVLALCGLFMKLKSGTYWGIVFTTAVILGGFVLGIINLPNVVQGIAGFARSLMA